MHAVKIPVLCVFYVLVLDICCFNHFIIQLIHNVKYLELIKTYYIIEAAPTCFGLQRNHYQGATASA